MFNPQAPDGVCVRSSLPQDVKMTLPGTMAFTGVRPTHVRHKVLVWICSLAVVTYFDRVCISGAAPFVSSELGLTPIQMGTVFSAFAVSYALFEVPTGWLGDRIGARKVITRIVAWWSAFTALTGIVHRFWTMVILRFLFGVGEAGMFPNSAKVFSRWMPKAERGFATGLMWMFGRLGGAVTPAIVVIMISRIGWRATFWVLGAIGFMWAGFFWAWFRDTPREKAEVNEAEAQLIERDRSENQRHGQVPSGFALG
jgi:MFS family permease